MCNNPYPTDADNNFMQLVLLEAAKGMGFTSPNPMVGAVIVKNNIVIASGYHTRDGAAHAEVEALSKLTLLESTGATLYVNLEPCCHYGRTPPCTQAIINAKIARVVVAHSDPDKRVAGKGISILQQAGIVVVLGVEQLAAEKLNAIYLFYKTYNRPYVVLKSALTLDGRIALESGSSKWISNESSRNIVHNLRLRLRAIAVGKNTVLTDKPSLNCRLPNIHNKPVDKIIFANNTSNIEAEIELMKGFAGRVFVVNNQNISNKADFYDFCILHNIDSVLVEGGGTLSGWFLSQLLVDRVMLFYKPAFLGHTGKPMAILNSAVNSMAELTEFGVNAVSMVDNNIFVDLYKGEPLCLLG